MNRTLFLGDLTMLSNISKVENLKEQYCDDKNLTTRINFNLKYGTNKKGLFSWLFEKYSFFDNCRILELGCGSGAQWENRINDLPNNCALTLSDFSNGMVDIVKEKYSKHKNLSFQQIDIQNIPIPDETFDFVIANHMLYHVPDLTKALSEVRRILKTGGIFYSTTNGNAGMRVFLNEAFKYIDPNTEAFTQQWSFSIQNGLEILSGFFSDVKRFDFENSLSITKTQDLIDWIKSTISMGNYSEKDIDCLFDYFEQIRKLDGAINISKESGLFISTK